MENENHKPFPNKWLFGWKNLRWLVEELIKVGTAGPSFFSKKRLESGAAFALALYGMMFYLFKKIDTMDIWDLTLWAATLLTIAGYNIKQIQMEKLNTKPKEDGNQQN